MQKAPDNPKAHASAVHPYPNYLYATHYSSFYLSSMSQNAETNPNPYPPGVDSYTSVTSSAQSQGGVYNAYYAQAAYARQQTLDPGSAIYYQDPNAVNSVQNWSIPYATGVALPQNGTKQLVPPQTNATTWPNATILPPRKIKKKKNLKKPKAIVQPVWCEVCKIECNSKDILDTHKSGKKHKKNLEKLKAALAPASVAPVMSKNPVIGPKEKPSKRKAKESEDLQSKKKKIVDGGAAEDAVRTCEICNVVCNSELVFKYHLAGQKHVAMVKKRGPRPGDTAGVAAAT